MMIKVSIKVCRRPIRSPRVPKMAAPTGLARNPAAKVESASSVPATGEEDGKRTVLNTRAAMEP
jgi:hypothetical protein